MLLLVLLGLLVLLLLALPGRRRFFSKMASLLCLALLYVLRAVLGSHYFRLNDT